MRNYRSALADHMDQFFMLSAGPCMLPALFGSCATIEMMAANLLTATCQMCRSAIKANALQSESAVAAAFILGPGTTRDSQIAGQFLRNKRQILVSRGPQVQVYCC